MNESVCPLTPPPDVSVWEQAYLRFETPAQEIKKFQKRLRALGAATWPKDARIVELFCGRGNGLRALRSLGFANIEGIDLSPRLVRCYDGPAQVHVGDCRALPFADASRDILIVQGGLHHLPRLPEDLDQTLDEAARVLGNSGRLVVVEPWLTPFLRFAHLLCEVRMIRAMSPKVDALATMIENEIITYEQWLHHPQIVDTALNRRFEPEVCTIGWGKLCLVARKR